MHHHPELFCHRRFTRTTGNYFHPVFPIFCKPDRRSLLSAPHSRIDNLAVLHIFISLLYVANHLPFPAERTGFFLHCIFKNDNFLLTNIGNRRISRNRCFYDNIPVNIRIINMVYRLSHRIGSRTSRMRQSCFHRIISGTFKFHPRNQTRQPLRTQFIISRLVRTVLPINLPGYLWGIIIPYKRSITRKDKTGRTRNRIFQYYFRIFFHPDS